jgi:hypothetical protein
MHRLRSAIEMSVSLPFDEENVMFPLEGAAVLEMVSNADVIASSSIEIFMMTLGVVRL